MGEQMIYDLVKGKLLNIGLIKGNLLLLLICFLAAVPVF